MITISETLNIENIFFFFFFFFFWSFLGPLPMEYGGSQARGLIGAVTTGLYHSHSNTGSEPHLRPTPQLQAMPDPQPTEPASSWILVGFVSSEPQWECPDLLLKSYSSWLISHPQ